jgi:sporulation protein YlmC with PRC-barrel domain
MTDPDTGALDAVLHLLDRQVVDRDGLMVCKVDDVELTVGPDGTWQVTGLLAGLPALVPRMGGRLGHRLQGAWRRLGVQQGDRLVPWRIPLALVAELGSGVELLAAREGLLQRQTATPPAPGEVRRRLNDLMHLTVRGPAGEWWGQVLDVRLERRSSEHLQLVVLGIVVGRGRPGGYLGYDRADDRGPWLLSRLVHRIHRHSRYLAWSDVAGIDWEGRSLVARGGLRPLHHPAR